MITEKMMAQLDYLYEQSRQVRDKIEINSNFWSVESVNLSRNKKGLCSHNTIFLNKKMSMKEKQDVLFHELIHAWLITYDPDNNTENNVRNIERQYYETRLQTEQYIIVQ
jgi:hypothetical protein